MVAEPMAAQYRLYRGSRQVAVVAAAVSLAIGAVVAFELLTSGAIALVVTGLLWSALVLYGAYTVLFRTVHVLVVAGDVLSWRTPLGHGSVAVADVGRIAPARSVVNTAVIELPGRRPLLVPVRAAFPHFARAVAAAHPDLDIQMPRFSRWIDRLRAAAPGYSRTH
jgi:hypothetical protein